MSNVSIGDHALISDCNSCALVTRTGSVDWLCSPRFDGPSIFGRLLDESAGHWSIRPTGDFEVSRRYVDRSMVLETTFHTSSGTLVLTDAMATGPNAQGHELGNASPKTMLRRATCTEGEVQLEVSYAPRPEYGLLQPLMFPIEGGLAARGGADVLVLSSPEGFDIADCNATARMILQRGESAAFALQQRSSWEDFPEVWDQGRIRAALDETIVAWQTWSDLHQTYDGPWREFVHHSGRVLQALTYQPTGAIVAAPTTSLPESVGGARNWDYRFTWVRDASLTLDALWVAACPDEAYGFFSWMTGAAAADVGRTSELQIMFGIGGEHDLSERELHHLSGWRDSRPVRIGNGAWDQRQLDVYGELLNAAHKLADQLGELDEATRGFLVAVADAAAAKWNEPDQGIWEIRGGPQHFLYSKLMCWVALDRAIALADRLQADDRVDSWAKTRDEISDAILQRGWSEQSQSFAQALGSDELDASSLMIPIVGFLPANDPRMLATIKATQERLTDERGLVYRYRAHDGLEGEEGTFLLCTFWLAQAQALADDVEGARTTFERAIAYINDVGLLAEEVDPDSGELLGNFPQAFSHIGLVNAAWAISQAEQRAS
jgi:alpha,alpha-trehalase